MIVFAGIVFFVSIVLTGALFALNLQEERTGRYPLAEWRSVADREALWLKELLMAADLDLKKVPPLLSYWVHVVLHFAALEFAHLAREASRQAHRLADLVSHKHHFQRRETRSEFLKKITEYKNGNGHKEREPVEF